MITPNMVDAVKVQFISDEWGEFSFVDIGMKAWLTKVELDENDGGCKTYKLYFDFTEFYDENLKYFTEDYYPNIHTANLSERPSGLYTAIEAGWYNHKEVIYVSVFNDFNEEISKHIKPVS